MVRVNAASEGEPSDGESFTDGDFCDSSSGDEGDAPGALRDPAGRQGALPVDEALNPNVKTQQDHAPVTQQDHAPETQHDHALQMQQEHEPETQRDHAPETQRDHEPETQRDHALETQREHEPETQRDHALETQREHEMDTQQVERRGSHVAEQPSIVGIIGMEHDEAEARLAARRAARAEAREIRMRELERQQREHEDNADKAYDMYSETVSTRPAPRATRLSATLSPTVHSPRRTSEDSTEEVLNIKDLRHDMKEVEEKFRKAMILNAQLDNDKASLSYQLELLKDRIEDLQEQHAQLQREHKEKCSAYERLKREHAQTEDELAGARAALVARDNAIAAAGLALVEAMEDAEAPLPPGLVNGGGPLVPVLALISKESNDILESAGEGTLDVRLQKLSTDKRELESEVRRLKLQLEEERCRERTHNGPVNGTTYNDYDSELETSKRLASEYKYRATKAEQEAALLGASAARLEAQVQRLRAAAERAEEAEDELKADKRRLQREAREALNRVEELETENSHLTKRLDKLKNAKSALLKEL